MAKYFNFFPKTYYSLEENSKSLDVITNIMTKFSFEQSFKDNTVVYYKYSIVDGDTPEALAHKFYNDSEKHWVILALNNITNVITEWPIDYRSLMGIIEKKYVQYADTGNNQTGLAWSKSNIHSYYKVETQTDTQTNSKIEKRIQVDANTYANVAVSSTNYTLQSNNVIKIDVTKETKTYYEYETEANEEKRLIKILKPEFVQAVNEEFKSLMKE